MTRAVATLIPMLVVASPSFAQSGASERILVDLEHEWALAVQEADAAAIGMIIADDYVGTTASGQIQSKAEYLAEFISGDRRVFVLTTDDLAVRVYGRVAVLTHGGHARGEYRGRPVTGEFRWTHVFVERDGRWQAVANHVTKIPAP